MAGKRALTVIAKARQNEVIKRKTEMERIRLKKAMDSMEVVVRFRCCSAGTLLSLSLFLHTQKYSNILICLVSLDSIDSLDTSTGTR